MYIGVYVGILHAYTRNTFPYRGHVLVEAKECEKKEVRASKRGLATGIEK